MAITAPLGIGKRSLCHAVLEKQPAVRLSISCTTRKPEIREIDGFDYLFISEKEFKNKINKGDFLEWVQIGKTYYGTPKSPLLEDLDQGHDVLLNLDTQGAKTIKDLIPQTVSVFVSPASWEALEERYRSLMGQDLTAERLKQAHKEILSAKNFDFVVLHDNLMHAVEDIAAILRAERQRAHRSVLSLSRLLESTPPAAPAS
jgi:guanylate kinase